MTNVYLRLIVMDAEYLIKLIKYMIINISIINHNPILTMNRNKQISNANINKQNKKIDNLPNELIQEIIDIAGERLFGIISFISRVFYHNLVSFKNAKKIKGKNKLYVCDVTSTITLLEWAREYRCPWNEKVCAYAAKNVDYAVLKYARSLNCSWDEDTCAG